MSTSTSAAQKHSRVLACVLCQHRKIKCDRNTPCSNCLKANVTCTPSTPAPARKRRRPNQDLQERLARCEDLLKQYAGTGPPPGMGALPTDPLTPNTADAADTLMDQPTTTSHTSFNEDSPPAWKPPGKMIKEEAGSRFMDSYVWATVMDQLHAMKEIIDAEEPDEASIVESDRPTPENHADVLFGGECSTGNLNELQPDPVHAFRLWQLFLDRVNPLLKLVHIPTLQPYVMEGAISISNVPVNYQALLFAVYAISTISLSEEEAPHILGMSRDEAAHRFTSGIKIALVRFDFLKNYDMAVLQALVLFLCSLQGRYDRHATWILSGTIVRIAQKMGYHRDGEFLNLPPFETEMRRRIWWQIILQDVKYAMVSGLSHSLLPVNWDTKEPQNVNDADLFPGLTEPVQAREGPTEMAFALVMFQLGRFMLEMASNPGFEAAMMGQPLPVTDDTTDPAAEMERYRAMLRTLEDNLKETENRYIDASAGNVHCAALSIRPLMVSKMAEILAPMDDENTTPKDRLMRLLVNTLEHNSDAYESLGKRGFIWFVKPHFQLEAFSVLTGLLADNPLGPLADRAWRGVQIFYHYHTELFDVSVKQQHMQALFTLKAWRARERAFGQAGRPLELPDYITRLRAAVPSFDSRASSQVAATPPNMSQPRPQLTELDSFLGGYLDVSSFQWDNMWNSMPTASPNQMTAPEFGNFHMGNLPDMKHEMGPY